MDKDKKKIERLIKQFKLWQSTDLVKAGYIFTDIELRNEAFARGWRFAIREIIRELEIP